MSTPSSMTQQEVLDAYQASIQNTYGKTPIVFVRGQGARLWDVDGRRYLDFVGGGRAGTALGHCHPDVTDALAEQLQTLLFVSNDFYNPWTAKLGQLLSARSGDRKVFF